MVKYTHLLNGHMLYVHIGIASMRQFQCVPATYVTEIKETYFEIYTKQVSCTIKHIKLPTFSDSDVMLCLQLLTKTLTCKLHLS